MKRILVAAFSLILGVNLYSQTFELEQLYNTYRGEKDVISIYIPGFLCRLAAGIDEMETQEQELLRSIKSLRIQVIENKEINRTVNFVNAYRRAKPSKNYIPMLEVHDRDQDVLILARQKEDAIRELVILVGGEENVMVWVKGRMDQDLMKNLFEVTGMEECRFTKEI